MKYLTDIWYIDYITSYTEDQKGNASFASMWLHFYEYRKDKIAR